MSLFKHIEDSIAAEAQKLVAAWHTTLAPWLKAFLSDLVHHEIETLAPFANQFVGQAAGMLATAIQSGNSDGFMQHTADLAKLTINAAKSAGIKVLETSAAAAVLSAVAAHPGVQAAYDAQAKLTPASP